jgi:hypothetical protein
VFRVSLTRTNAVFSILYCTTAILNQIESTLSGMHSAKITNYDVLVEPPIPGKGSGEFQLDKGQNHAGNNRLEVFFNMNRQSYDAARQRADFNECNKIVDKIVATVCHQCVPNGRFLVSSTNDGTVLWNQMDEQSAKLLLHSILQPVNILPQLSQQVDDAEKKILPQLSQQVDDAEKKRRRRSSLLRRSASESMVGMVLDNKKKLSRFRTDQTQEEPSDWKSTRAGGLTLRRMDVILTQAGNALDPNSQSVGNNRLHILVAMQSSKYQTAPIAGKEAIVDEVIQTVNTFWKGRFLVQGANGHEELTKDEARHALRSIFLMRAGQSLPKRSSLPTSSAMALPMRAGPVRQASAPAIPNTFERQTSASMINSGPAMNMPEVEGLRLAAVDLLKKKKARQNMASRIENNGRQNMPQTLNSFGQNPAPPISFEASRAPQKRESTVLGKLDPSLMNQLVADFDDTDFNDSDGPDPLPPTNSNKFGGQFSGGGDYM